MTRSNGRTVAEWVTFGVSCAILAAVLVLIATQLSNSDDPAAPVAAVDAVRLLDGRHYVDVLVTNQGDDPAANIQVNAALVIDASTTQGDQTIDFLAADEEVQLTFVFDDDPALGELTVAVTGFTDP
jgi:uncharacterized protein (TIGR02588 family)